MLFVERVGERRFRLLGQEFLLRGAHGMAIKSPRLSPRACDFRGVTKMVRTGCQNGTSESYAGSGARRCAAGLACAGFSSLSFFERRSWICSAMISVT